MTVEYIYNHYLKECSYQNMLLKIAALTQYEIDVDLSWIAKHEDFFSQSYAAQKDGLIQASKRFPYPNACVTFLKIYHPTIAQYFLKAASYSYDTHLYNNLSQFSLLQLVDYLNVMPFNFFRVFEILYENKRDLCDILIRKKELVESGAKIIQEAPSGCLVHNALSTLNFIQLVADANVVSNEWIVQNLLTPRIMRIYKIGYENLACVSVFFNLIKKLHLNGKNLTSGIDFSFYGKLVAQHEENIQFRHLEYFIWNAHEAGVSHNNIAAFCNELDLYRVAKQVNRDDITFDSISNIIHYCVIFGVNEHKIIDFISGLDFKELTKKSRQRDVPFSVIANFIVNCRNLNVSCLKLITFCNDLIFSNLAEMANNETPRFDGLSIFIDSLVSIGVERQQIYEFISHLNFSRILTQIKDNQDDLSANTVMAFICHIRWAGISNRMIYLLCSLLNPLTMSQKVQKEKVAFSLIFKFIESLHTCGISETFTNDFCSKLNFQNLGAVAQERTQLVQIMDFVVLTRWAAVDHAKVQQFLLEIDFEKLAIAASNNYDAYEKITRFVDALYWAKFDFYKIMQFYKLLTHTLLGYSSLIKVASESGIDVIADSTNYFINNKSSQDVKVMLKQASPYCALSAFFLSFNVDQDLIKKILSEDAIDSEFFHEIFCLHMPNWCLGEIGGYLLSMHLIKRPVVAHAVISTLEMQMDKILSRTESEKIESIAFFLWSVWMTYRENEISIIFRSNKLLSLLKQRISFSQGEITESALEISGIFNLIYKKQIFHRVPIEYTETIKNMCLKDIDEKQQRYFLMSANYLNFSNEEKKTIIDSCYRLRLPMPATNLMMLTDRLKFQFNES